MVGVLSWRTDSMGVPDGHGHIPRQPFPVWHNLYWPWLRRNVLLCVANMMHRWHVLEFQVLRVLEPTLRMKAQVNSSNRGWKDFICKEEKRKTMGKLLFPWVELGIGFNSIFEYCLSAEMSLRCRQKFPGKERCLLDHLSPFGTSCSPSFSISHSAEGLHVSNSISHY
jgi:hypothetical protein